MEQETVLIYMILGTKEPSNKKVREPLHSWYLQVVAKIKMKGIFILPPRSNESLLYVSH